MCSTVASSPILAAQLAERALTAYNYCQNHLLALSVNVIGSASTGLSMAHVSVNFCKSPEVFSLSPSGLERTSCRHCITGAILPCPVHSLLFVGIHVCKSLHFLRL